MGRTSIRSLAALAVTAGIGFAAAHGAHRSAEPAAGAVRAAAGFAGSAAGVHGPEHAGPRVRFYAGPVPAAGAGFPLALQERPAGAEARRSGPREFYFTRGIYSSGLGTFRGRRRSWATDFPKADHQFLVVLKRLTNLDAYDLEHPVRLDDPELRRYPFLYVVEVGYMSMTEEEVRGLRDYLLAGGFLVVDDFWGSWEWRNFESEMRRVFPYRSIEDIRLDHEIFHVFYDIEEILQVPAIQRGMRGGPTWERDGYVPAVRGIFDDDGRLMVVINWNTDLGDAWEWAENPYYPLRFSTYSYQMGVNFIVYAMSH